jgi:hypothetical protein
LASITRYPLGTGSTDQGLGKRRDGITKVAELLVVENGNPAPRWLDQINADQAVTAIGTGKIGRKRKC